MNAQDYVSAFFAQRQRDEQRMNEAIEKLSYTSSKNLSEYGIDYDLSLNPILLVKQNIDEDRFNLLCAEHANKLKIIAKMQETEKDDISTLRFLAESITQIEFNLQKLWGFSKNANFHRFWELPHCTCPKMDNEDSYGSDRHYISSDCPVHGMSNRK